MPEAGTKKISGRFRSSGDLICKIFKSGYLTSLAFDAVAAVRPAFLLPQTLAVPKGLSFANSIKIGAATKMEE